jgi:CheY-like chemotaxis protein
MDGIETVANIRAMAKENPSLATLPIIALTANAVSGVREMFIKNGFNDFLAKPIEIQLLDSTLKRWLPEAKLEERSEENEAAKIMGALEFKNIKIKGIDVETGVYMTGGNAENYLRTLSIFKDDGIEKITLLRDCLVKNNLNLYAVHVHALKSASSSIGAMKISKLARSLEMSAKNDDWDFVLKNNEKFIEELLILLESIENTILTVRAAKKKKNVAVKDVDMVMILEKASVLKDALVAFDMAVVDEVLLFLKTQVQPDSAMDALIDEISNNVLTCEYDKAKELVEELEGMRG